jgi:hypothetical protein
MVGVGMARKSTRHSTLRIAFLCTFGFAVSWNIFSIQNAVTFGHDPSRAILTLTTETEHLAANHLKTKASNKRKQPSSEFFAACLLVMDDNHFLTEWVAYHYHVLPLRHLIVAVDPRSQTSPQSIIERWNNHSDLNIVTWWKDSDYISNQTELDEAESWVALKFLDDNPSQELIRHRARQRLFYYHCLQEHRREKRTYTILTDTDEYVTINYATVNNTKSPMVASRMIPPITTPGSVLQLLQHEHKYHANNSTLIETPCIQIPRSRFGTFEDDRNSDETSREAAATAAGLSMNASQFATLRWLYHAAPQNYFQNRISKTVIDVSRITLDSDLRPVDSIHRPLKQYCGQRKLHIRAHDQLLLLHHYLGTWEQYNFRQDARQGNERSLKVRTRNISMVWCGTWVRSLNALF